MNDSRDIKLQNIRGIIIFLIVFSSSILSYNFRNSIIVSDIVKIIYTFTLPIFCIITGYYSRNKKDNKQLIRFFGLFMIMNFIFYIYEYITTGFISSTIIKYSSWYVIDFIIWRILYKYITNKQVAFVINIVFIILLSIIPNSFNILNIDTLIYYFSYFLLGSSFNILIDDETDRSLLKLIVSLLVITIIVKLCNYEIDFYFTLYSNNYLYVLIRLIFYIIVIIILNSLYNLIPGKRLKFLTDIGKKSLSIYFLYGFITIIFSNILHENKFIILLGLVLSIVICIVFSSNIISRFIKILMIEFEKWYNWIILITVISLGIGLYIFNNRMIEIKDSYLKYNIVSKDNIMDINNRSITIGFTGSISLLEEQIKDSYNKDKYDFNYMFNYINNYTKDVNYMIGDIEGISDDDKKYTLYNTINDKIKINVPSSIFKALKDNNYDLVNISNQRILDYGKDSLFKTIDNINSSKLDYTGVYHNEDDKKVKIVDIEGIKTGIISYTYEPKDIELDKDNQYVANFLCNEDSKDFDDVKDKVNNDFKQLRNNGAELILVIVHNSYNNNHVYDKTQKVWNELFAKLGADIVLGNNSSSVQRIEYYDKTVVVNSTGNMISNEYGEDNDLSMMVKIYVDKDRKDINAISIIPLYSFKENNKGYVTIPIYDGFNNSELNKKLSYKDIERMKKGIEIISKESMDVLLNNDILEKEYFYFTDGYKRQEVEKLDLSVEEENSSIYKVMKKSNKTCYIGDDYTAGNKNGGFGWFEPLVSTFDNEYVKISNIGINSSDAVNKYKDIINNSNCDLYVVALGSNDIRKNYLNVDEYIKNIDELMKDVKKDIIMVAPWEPLEIEYDNSNDYYHDMELFEVYGKRLKKYCDINKCIYVNPNNYIKSVIDTSYVEIYYNDSYYPNSNKGIRLFSRSLFHG